MGELSEKYIKAKRAVEAKAHPETLNAQERAALVKMRKEARRSGAVLTNNGKGGLRPSLVLGVMRRDGFRCKTCGGDGTGDKGGIGVHHKGGIVESKWLDKKGHQSTPNNLSTICNACHDNIHNKARAEGVDSSQVKPKGDEGIR